jgi:hypothetical protein
MPPIVYNISGKVNGPFPVIYKDSILRGAERLQTSGNISSGSAEGQTQGAQPFPVGNRRAVAA